MPTAPKATAEPPPLPTILEKLTAAVPELRRRFKVARVGVFGSYARGQESAGSDLDVLVDFAEDWQYSDLFDLQERLNALLGIKVDVVSREGLKPYIGRRILAEVVWIDDPSDARRALAVIRERPASRRPEREIRDFLHDILDNIEAVNGFVADGDFGRLVSDRMYRYAFLHALFLIGEATTHIPGPLRQSRSEIPWRRIVGLRNVVAHNYPELDLEKIWDTAHQGLGALKVAVSEILVVMNRREQSG